MRSTPTQDTKTRCRSRCRSTACTRRRVPATSTCQGSPWGSVAAWTTTSAPASAVSRSRPVARSPRIPPGPAPRRDISFTVCPASCSGWPSRRPSRPVPPVTSTSMPAVCRLRMRPRVATRSYLTREITWAIVTLTDAPTDTAMRRIGSLVRDARRHHGLTQQQLAERLGTSQSAVARIEQGNQNLTLELLGRLSAALESELISLGPTGPTHLRVAGGHALRGSVAVKSSKNAAVALLCAALLNRGRTTLRNVARIVEVERILDVLRSIGVSAVWDAAGHDLTLVVPDELDLAAIDADAARRTRSIIMFLGPLLHRAETFELPYAGGCDLGTRTVEPHMSALRPFGLEVKATEGSYHATVEADVAPRRPIVLTERGDTVTENALMAAARLDSVTVIRNASSNYMVQDLCFYLEALGVKVEGVGTTTLTVHGRPDIDVDVDYAPSEDPIEAMSLLAAAIVTGSEITICRAPI